MSLRQVTLLWLLLANTGCETTAGGHQHSRVQTGGLLTRLEVVTLDLGEFPIEGRAAVLDGDTLRLKGLQASVRLLAIDTEETFKKETERAAFAAGWEAYKKQMRGNSLRPVKMATPAGEEAKQFAQAFFDGADSVRLERDHPGEIRDFYGRYLSYVYVKKGGQWVNYNLECVRAGHSPYFTKYGRSRRFHREFVEAQKQAIAAERGIWKPNAMHYDDYDERLQWWSDREASINRFEHEQAEHPESYVALTRWDSLLKLEQRLGQEVTLLGTVQDVILRESGPAVVKLARTRAQNFDIVFWDRDVLLDTGLQFKRGEYVRVRGVVQKYRNARGLDALQVQVTLPGQVLSPSVELEQMLATDAKSAGNGKDEGE